MTVSLPNGIIMGHHSYGAPQRRGNANIITVGKFCSLAKDIVMDGGFNHRTDFISTYPFHKLDSKHVSNIEHPRDIVIENDVWIGEGCLIMSGVHIHSGAIIAARSVVTKDKIIGPYEIWAGVPARRIRKRFSDIEIIKLLKLAWWNFEEDEILKITPLLMSNKLEELFKLYNL